MRVLAELRECAAAVVVPVARVAAAGKGVEVALGRLVERIYGVGKPVSVWGSRGLRCWTRKRGEAFLRLEAGSGDEMDVEESMRLWDRWYRRQRGAAGRWLHLERGGVVYAACEGRIVGRLQHRQKTHGLWEGIQSLWRADVSSLSLCQ